MMTEEQYNDLVAMLRAEEISDTLFKALCNRNRGWENRPFPGLPDFDSATIAGYIIEEERRILREDFGRKALTTFCLAIHLNCGYALARIIARSEEDWGI